MQTRIDDNNNPRGLLFNIKSWYTDTTRRRSSQHAYNLPIETNKKKRSIRQLHFFKPMIIREQLYPYTQVWSRRFRGEMTFVVLPAPYEYPIMSSKNSQIPMKDIEKKKQQLILAIHNKLQIHGTCKSFNHPFKDFNVFKIHVNTHSRISACIESVVTL